ncbi:MAG: hypothetical protein IPN53_22925 [Comamonadaceae bacterium]|nr:hypothetical protein [Comamonadaceae bacterium]
MLQSVHVAPAGQQRIAASIDFVLYDLVAYYPLIDGDSADPQDMTTRRPCPPATPMARACAWSWSTTWPPQW